MNKQRIFISILAIWLVIVSCSLPGFAPQATQPPVLVTAIITATGGSAPLIAASETPSPTATLPGPTVIPPTSCSANIVAGSVVNVRSGPGMVYSTVGSLPAGASATVAGKNSDGTWWYINFPGGPGGYGWVSASVVTSSCIPTTLAVIAAPPTPLPASGTCKDAYVWRLITPSDKICVSAASKSQADADNAAADSRKIVNIYGYDACITGYVWRAAYSGDVVCVTEAVRAQAAADNVAAPSRWVPGPYGPHTCIAGFVWRGARAGDDVCVTPDVQAQVVADNAAASSRKAVNVYGADACISGYVWRAAFSGDNVCVTPAVRDQTAADNAAAPSHTWP